MRYRSTPKSQRTTYRQYDEDGHLLYEFTPDDNGRETDINIIRENQEKIAAMHRYDDAELKRRSRAEKIPEYQEKAMREERERIRQDFIDRYGCEPDPSMLPDCYHRGYVYIDAEAPNGDSAEDKNPVQEMIADDPFEEESSSVNALRELMMAEFTDREKEIYWLVYIEGLAKGEAALIMGIKPWWASQLIKSIKKKIADSDELKKFFR